MTLPSDLYDGLDPTPAASVLAYTDSCTNAPERGQLYPYHRDISSNSDARPC